MIESVWANTAEKPSFPRLSHDIKTDVLIIGGGLAGILCAYMLQNVGIDYMLIEADEICSAVTRNTTAKITSQHGLIYHKLTRMFGPEKARMYYDANEAALEQYRQICASIQCDFEEKDAYVYETEKTVKIEKELNALEKMGISAEYADNLPLPVKIAGAVRFKNQAQFNPLKFLYSISRDLKIYEYTKALEFDGNTVVTSGGKVSASKIIVATHFPILNKHGSYFLKMYQHRSYVLALENAPEIDGMFLDENEYGLSFRNYNGMLLIGGGSHRTGKEGGNWAELERFAEKNYPNCRIVRRWATQDCMTLDGVPYVGKYSANTQDLYVATGFNKWGVTSSMVASMVLSDLVQGKDNTYAELFSPSRTILRPQLFVNAFDATVNLLTISKPRCPHMGCALKWNRAERSWDCPCHGSRFSESGKLLNNPSTGDLKQKS